MSCSDSNFERSNISLKENTRDGVDPNSNSFDYCVRQNERKLYGFRQTDKVARSIKTAKTGLKKMCKSTEISATWEKTGNCNRQVFQKAISSFQLAIHSEETFLGTVLLQWQHGLKCYQSLVNNKKEKIPNSLTRTRTRDIGCASHTSTCALDHSIFINSVTDESFLKHCQHYKC